MHDSVRLCRDGHRSLPTYTVTPTWMTIPLPLASLLPRIIPLSMRKVASHARWRESNDSSRTFKTGKATGHAMKLEKPGKRPVTLDPVKWRNVDYRIVRQLANFFDMTTEAYVAEVLRH